MKRKKGDEGYDGRVDGRPPKKFAALFEAEKKTLEVSETLGQRLARAKKWARDHPAKEGSELAKARAKRAANQKQYREMKEARRRAEEADRGGGTIEEPVVTEATAREWARLIASGVPPHRAAEYMSPSYCARIGVRFKKKYASRMVEHPMVVLATAELNGGEWHHLDRERRLQLALDKHLAELAHFLYTHSYVSMFGDNAKKMDNAADKLLKYLADSEGDPNSPWKTFVAEFMQKFEKEHPRGESVQ